ncbi:hypothetical protein SmJEL517_g05175 [Synchytrium microbalum]|uniref:N-acetyltransferase domain-containing protein n=1 Tax=Synchytrium microbalum TaxID=1806994 RepID=A0A507BXF2_9FUNG|nr:uncharacterized protein SmJEL517_g05175 [Synchytrium microbalum]TPX31529.1 hypothetical protein SmJEL517_g05175 [Synchytrium microbalum]
MDETNLAVAQMSVSTINLEPYKDESQLQAIMSLIENDLSEPYTVFTYRYFMHQWPDYCYLAMDGEEYIGVIICRLEPHQGYIPTMRGYIAMLAVRTPYRKLGVGSRLVQKAVAELKRGGADEVDDVN